MGFFFSGGDAVRHQFAFWGPLGAKSVVYTILRVSVRWSVHQSVTLSLFGLLEATNAVYTALLHNMDSVACVGLMHSVASLSCHLTNDDHL